MRTSRRCSASENRGWRKRRPMPLALGAAALLLCGSAYAQPETVARNAALAAALLPGAIDAFSLGYSSEAIELVDEALAFVPSNPDANYLRSLYGLSTGETLGVALARLERALAGGSFLRFAKDDAQALYASLLVRTHRSAEALRMVSAIPENSETLYIESVAKRQLGDEPGARGRFRYLDRPATTRAVYKLFPEVHGWRRVKFRLPG